MVQEAPGRIRFHAAGKIEEADQNGREREGGCGKVQTAMATSESLFRLKLSNRKQYGSPPHQCGMDKTKREELEKAYKKEKNPRMAARMLAVHMVYVREKSVSATAADLM